MFEKITPKQAGISSKTVTTFIQKLEKRGSATHGFLMMKGDKIFAEGYWKPFHKDFCHRMYSQTKSFVGVAIGLLEEDGKLSLEDKIVDYFPEKLDKAPQPYLARKRRGATRAGNADFGIKTSQCKRRNRFIVS